MKSNNLTTKIPSFLAYKIDGIQNDAECQYVFTVFKMSKQVSYVIEISSSGLQKLPHSFDQNCWFYQTQQKISKQNKSLILQKYSVCTCDEINKQIQKCIIVNFVIQGPTNIMSKIIGFQSRNLKGSSSKIFGLGETNELIKLFCQYSKQTWAIYINKYQKTVNEKKQLQQNYFILPYLQFQASVIRAPQLNQQIQKGIVTSQASIRTQSILFNIESLHQNVAKKMELFLVQKIQQKMIQSSLNSVSILSSWNGIPKKVFNPHIYAKYFKKQKYELITVKGVYQFYHYGDQGFNDNGWGCAYRALQTLLSWLHIQGHIDKMNQMMTINLIQQKLDSFDRSRRLKGSSAWIGATQISWIVPTLTTQKINCKILHVSDGKQIIQKCQQFKNHFLTTGSPIMYGGGQYAYSIVGMHYSWKLGQCQFLILDPHYTGQDQYAKIVQKKGLCWRKPQQMFKKGIFYNFCLPLIK